MSSDILSEIPDKDLRRLQDMFRQRWPYYLNTWYFLDNYIDWKNKGATDTKFYCPDGRWDDGTFIAIDDQFVFSVFAFTLEENCSRLKDALVNTKRIPWTTDNNIQIYFVTVHESVYPTITKVINEKRWNVVNEDIAKMWWIPKEEAVKYEYSIPEGTYIAPLVPEDVPIINDVWPHKSPVSHLYLESLITLNGGFGLYNKSTNELCSWIMRNNYGGLAILQTREEDRRKGYGALLTKYFSKHWAEKGLDIFCFIMTHNTTSQKLFKNLGYKMEHGINWLVLSKQK